MEQIIAAILDTETTGTSKLDKVIEVAYLPLPALEDCATPLIATPTQEFIQRYHTKVPINPFAQAVHGITPADLIGKPPTAQLETDLAGLLGSSYWIGHKIDFDVRMTQYTLGKEFPDIRQICTHSLAVRLLTVEEKAQIENLRLVTLAKFLFPEYSAEIDTESHSALGDCSIVLMVLSEFIKRAAVVSWEDLWKLANSGKKEKKEKKLTGLQLLDCWPNFGQHKGESFSDIPERYLIWARDNLNFTRPGGKDLLHTINHWISKGK